MISPAEFWPLSPREETILLLYADGLNRAQIAAELGISPHTVKWHTTSMRMKLEARTIAHAVALAYQYGELRVAT